MWFKKLTQRFFKRNSICNKCNSPTQGKVYCDKCQEYIDCMELKKNEEINAKEELKRRNWIRTRNEFLNNKND